MSKVVDLDQLTGIGELQKVVLCHGVFDLLHVGHVRHLQAAKRFGGLLVVTVTPDRYVFKGPGRPVICEADRAEMLAALACVDCVAVNRWPTAVPLIEVLRPAVYCKGDDSRGDALRAEREAVEAVGGRLVFTNGEQRHTTAMLEKIRADFFVHPGQPRVRQDHGCPHP